MNGLNLVVLGRRMGANASDKALELFRNFTNSFLFLHNGKPWNVHWAQSIGGDSLEEEKLRSFGEEQKIDILYLRLSHFDPVVRFGWVPKIINLLKPRKVVLGYHCHLSYSFDEERKLFEIADAYILLNHQASIYFSSLYPYIGNRPIFFLPSLYLPAFSWYFKGGLGLSNANKNSDQLVVGGQLLRGTAPTQGRFSYGALFQELMSSYINWEIDCFGEFENAQTEAFYRENFKQVNFLGKLPQPDYQKLLSKSEFGFMNGWIYPSNKILAFEHQNYPIRLPSYLKSKVKPVVFKGTSTFLENWILQTNFGVVVSAPNAVYEITNQKKNSSRLHSSYRALLFENSFDFYISSLMNFFHSLL